MHTSALKRFFVFAAAAVLVGVSGAATAASAQVTLARADSPTQSSPLRIGDVLRIKVWPDSSLGGEFPVEETGLVHLPLIGPYVAAGRPISAIREELRALYGKELKSPVVTVTPTFRVSVLGAVERPGLYFADPTQTWFDLISNAGGFTSDADRTGLRVLREGTTLRINAATEELETGQSLNVAVQSGDRILVPTKSPNRFPLILSLTQTVILIAVAIHQLQ